LDPHLRGRQISGDPRPEFLARLAGSLGGGWLERRRFVRELGQHLEDCVAELSEAGVPEDAAVRDAMARLGDVDAIVEAVRATRSNRSLSWRRVGRVPVAWIAVGAMSIVTFAAAELPQASGAKVPGPQLAPATHAEAQKPKPLRREYTSTPGHAKSRSQQNRTCRCSRDVARGRSRS
jgi:uncharacterized protein YjiS (DUF1127 family)